MGVFYVPDDFALVSLAVASPLVQKGDIIMVRQGAQAEVVVVPREKRGIRILADRGDGVVPEPGETGAETENEVAAPEPEVSKNRIFITVPRYGGKMVRMPRGSPGWVIAHRGR